MEKDITITKLVEKLKLALNLYELEVVDYWEADLCSIGLIKENKLIYISTYNYLNNVEPRYDFDFELIEDKTEKMNVIKCGRNVNAEELIIMSNEFLKD